VKLIFFSILRLYLQGKISGANNLTNIVGGKFSVFFEIMNMCKREKNINKKKGGDQT